MRTISRDPFARENTIRRKVHTKCTCAWCGNTRPDGALFQYGVHRDGLYTRPEYQRELFCSISCMRIYHE